MAWWQIVVKKPEATKQNKDQNFNNKNKHWTDKKTTHTKQQNGRRGAGGKKANN